MLDAAEEILPQNDGDWDKVATLFNERYAVKHGRSTRTSHALKLKYHDTLFGVPTGGGEAQPLQVRARGIEQKISEAAGVKVSDSKCHEKSQKQSPRKGSRLKVEKDILSVIDKSESSENERFTKLLEKQDERLKLEQEKLKMFSEYIKKL